MRILSAAFVAAAILLSGLPAQAAEKYAWDGYGSGSYSKCAIYGMHIEFTVENGTATGWWQQHGRVVREFRFPVAADGSFTGKVNIGPSDMNVAGNVGANPEIKLRGYCNFGGPAKKE